MVHQPHL